MSATDPLDLHPLSLNDEEEPLDAPPPYESIILEKPDQILTDTEGTPTPEHQPFVYNRPISTSEFGRPHNPAFKIRVVDPVKQGEGVGAYISYKIISTVELQGYRSGQHEVIRRFRDFTWLKYRLRSQYKGVIPPALPEKNAIEKYKMDSHFIEQRRAALEVYLNRVAAHPILSHSPDMQLFLQSDETEFAIEASRSAAEAGDAAPAASGGAANAARKTIGGAMKLFKSLGQHAAQLSPHSGGRARSSSSNYTTPLTTGSSNAMDTATNNSISRHNHADEEERSEYLQVRAYFIDLEAHLSEAYTHSERVVLHYSKLANAFAEFSAALSVLSRHQSNTITTALPPPLLEDIKNDEAASSTVPSTPSLSNQDINKEAIHSLSLLSEHTMVISSICQRTSDTILKSFQVPMKEFVRLIRAAKKAMSDRSEALAAKIAARADVDACRDRLGRLRGTPGIKEERVIEAERDLQRAHSAAESANRYYESIVERMDGDIGRFQKERIEEMAYVLSQFAVVEAKAAHEMSNVWSKIA